MLHSKHNNGPIVEGCTEAQFSKCTYKNFTFIINNDVNQYCSLFSGEIIIIQNITFNEIINNYVIVGIEFLKTENIYNTSCDSGSLGKVSKLSEKKMWPLNKIKTKYFVYKLYDDYFAFPLLHSEKEEIIA